MGVLGCIFIVAKNNTVSTVGEVRKIIRFIQ